MVRVIGVRGAWLALRVVRAIDRYVWRGCRCISGSSRGRVVRRGRGLPIQARDLQDVLTFLHFESSLFASSLISASSSSTSLK